jgi:hypothetical protein
MQERDATEANNPEYAQTPNSLRAEQNIVAASSISSNINGNVEC